MSLGFSVSSPRRAYVCCLLEQWRDSPLRKVMMVPPTSSNVNAAAHVSSMLQHRPCRTCIHKKQFFNIIHHHRKEGLIQVSSSTSWAPPWAHSLSPRRARPGPIPLLFSWTPSNGTPLNPALPRPVSVPTAAVTPVTWMWAPPHPHRYPRFCPH